MNTLLSINNYYYRRSGAEVVFLGHNELFNEHGWEVIPFSMRHAENLPSEYAGYFVDEIEYGASYSTIGAVSRAAKVVYSFEARRNLGSLLERREVAVAHCHCIYHHISPSILATLERLQIPVVMTLHDLKIACPAYFMYRDGQPCDACNGGRYRNVVRHRCVKNSLALSAVVYLESTLHKLLGSYSEKVAAYVSPSQFYIDLLISWGWNPGLFHHVPNFIDTSGISSELRTGEHFGYVGRLSREKGVALLVEASAQTRLPVRIAGDGPERESLQQLARRLDAPVEFIGSLDRAQVLSFMAGCRATIVPSVWYENCPMTILESYAACTPVIGASIGGIPELIETGQTGSLFTAGDASALAACMVSYAGMDDTKVSAMGRCARERVEDRYSPLRYFTAMCAIYQSLRAPE